MFRWLGPRVFLEMNDIKGHGRSALDKLSTNSTPGTKMANTKIFDVLIVGGGFAGLSAAGTLARQLHTVVVFDSGSYRNARSKHLHMMPTWDHQDPESFRAATRADLERYDTVELYKTEIVAIAKGDDAVFEAKDSSGRQWRGRKVILANGVMDQPPALSGYDECWARAM